ncbi:hypothetical protein [Abditibacterium utsteinense]|uniref:hypothetical protein n=1 Tax=Abditibacterium utsteinense TaxID=1960156 RepID=UPI000F45FF8E|nr:hypothetical protein [Abditibacterium utsteinense]
MKHFHKKSSIREDVVVVLHFLWNVIKSAFPWCFALIVVSQIMRAFGINERMGGDINFYIAIAIAMAVQTTVELVVKRKNARHR